MAWFPPAVPNDRSILLFMIASLAPLAWIATHPVTRRHPFRTWGRWFYWQVRQRFTDAPKVISFVRGTRLAVYKREGLTGYWYLQLPEYEEMTFLERFLRPGDHFLDVGANAGAFSIFAASLGCKVTAFEPVPQTFARLRENLELNPELKTIEALNAATGAAAGTLRMTTGYGTGNRILQDGENLPSTEVNVVRLDAVIPDAAPPVFAKIDVEGHEWDVIQGATSLLASGRLLGLLIETFRPHNWQLPPLRALEARLAEHGFLPYDYDAHTHEIRELKKPDEGGANTFYFRDPAMVRSRLSARK